MVMGTCVYHVAHQRFWQAMGNIGQNVELPQFTQALYDARELAMSRMQAEAEQLHAEGIVGVQLLSHGHRWGGHTTEFFAIGTAVRPLRSDHHIPTPQLVLPLTDREHRPMTLEPGEPHGLGPMFDVQLLAATLRADRADVASYARVLSGALADALPAGMVEVEHHRSLADRVSGRAGRPVAVVVHGADRELHLREAAHGAVEAQVHQVVRGVVISRRTVDIDQWLHALAEDLTRIAARDAAARSALDRLLNGGGPH